MGCIGLTLGIRPATGPQSPSLARAQDSLQADVTELRQQLSEVGAALRQLQHKHAEWEDPAGSSEWRVATPPPRGLSPGQTNPPRMLSLP